jgi:hypothetical protein
VTVAEPERGSTRVEVVPVVGGEGNGHRGVLSTVAVGVANKRGFPVGVQLAVGDSYSGATVCDIKETIIAKMEKSVNSVKRTRGKQLTSPRRVAGKFHLSKSFGVHKAYFIMIPVAGEVEVVKPHLRRGLDTDGVSS